MLDASHQVLGIWVEQCLGGASVVHHAILQFLEQALHLVHSPQQLGLGILSYHVQLLLQLLYPQGHLLHQVCGVGLQLPPQSLQVPAHALVHLSHVGLQALSQLLQLLLQLLPQSLRVE